MVDSAAAPPPSLAIRQLQCRWDSWQSFRSECHSTVGRGASRCCCVWPTPMSRPPLTAGRRRSADGGHAAQLKQTNWPGLRGSSEMSDVASKMCVPCRDAVGPLAAERVVELQQQISPNWRLVDQHLQRRIRFRNFREALTFVNSVGAVAEACGHHPDLFLSWKTVRLTIWTHQVRGLTEADFVLAGRIDLITVGIEDAQSVSGDD